MTLTLTQEITTALLPETETRPVWTGLVAGEGVNFRYYETGWEAEDAYLAGQIVAYVRGNVTEAQFARLFDKPYGTATSFTADVEHTPSGKWVVEITLYDTNGEETAEIRYHGYSDYDAAESDLRERRREMKGQGLAEAKTDY